jgi:hypothetical protein
VELAIENCVPLKGKASTRSMDEFDFSDLSNGALSANGTATEDDN